MEKKSVFKIALLLFLIFCNYFILHSLFLKGDRTIQMSSILQGVSREMSSLTDDTKQGKIAIVNMDAETLYPLENTEFKLLDKENNVIDVLITDVQGRVTTGLLDYGTSYTLKQSKIKEPYKLDALEVHLEISESYQEVIFKNEIHDFVKSFKREGRQIKIEELFIPVETVMQLPELPNGCEITALTAVLRTYGYEVTKTEMADHYLAKEEFYWLNGKLYGANPYHAYAGNPRDEPGGFFTYAPPVINATQRYLTEVGGIESTYDISGSSREEIIAQLNKGIPVVIWVTRDMREPRINYSWYFSDTGEYFPAPVNLHSVVLNGYTENKVHVMDPLKGQVMYDADIFFATYDALGYHALIVVQDENRNDGYGI